MSPRPDIMVAPEVAEWLRISELTVYRMAKRGELPHFTLGGGIKPLVRFRRADIENYIARHQQQPSQAERGLHATGA